MEKEFQQSNPILSSRISVSIIVLMSGIIFFWALGEPAYWDRDEPRNAGCAAEMMARGNWIVPTFNDELRQQKPPLLYWLMGVAYSVFGVNEFAGRFFSALLAVGTVVATWGIARCFFDKATALLASMMLASSLMFCVAARAATPDSVLIFCVAMAFWFFANGYKNQKANPFTVTTSFWGVYLFLGLAMLAKGPVGFLLPIAVMGWFLLQRDWIESDRSTDRSGLFRRIAEPFAPMRFLRTLVSMRVIFGAIVSLMIAAPWFIAVGVATEGEFLTRFFLDENFGRATKVLENHSGGVWYYPLAILVGFFPWSVFWGPVAADLSMRTFRGNVAKERLDAGTRFAIAWIVIQVVAFSMVKTKLPSYVTPCYPALAMLTAHATVRMIRSVSTSPAWLWNVAYGAMLLSGIGISVGLWVAAGEFEPIPIWLSALGAAPIAIALMGWVLLKSASVEQKLNLAFYSTVIASAFCVGLLGAGAASVGKQNRMALAESIRGDESAQVATFGCHESSWVYYCGKPIVELRMDAGEDSNAAVRYANRKFWQRKPWLSPTQFVSFAENGLIITTDEHWPDLKKKLPDDWKVIQTAGWFMKEKELLLVGRSNSIASVPKNKALR